MKRLAFVAGYSIVAAMLVVGVGIWFIPGKPSGWWLACVTIDLVMLMFGSMVLADLDEEGWWK